MFKGTLFCIFLMIPLSASIHHDIDTTKSLCCDFSYKHHNRIMVDQGRVKKVIFAEDKLFVRMEEISGQVFVQAKQPIKETILLSVVTQNGQIQDIEISLSDRPPQVVMLKEFASKSCCRQSIAQHTCAKEYESTNDIIECVLKEEIPPGYVSVPFKRCQRKIKSGVVAILIGKLQGSQDDLLIYQVVNKTCFNKTIIEGEVRDAARWTYLTNNKLASKQSVLAITSVAH